MNKDTYQVWPIRFKWNIRTFGPRIGKPYLRFGMGSRWETGWIGRQDAPDSKKLLGWSFFAGPVRLVFGDESLLERKFRLWQAEHPHPGVTINIAYFVQVLDEGENEMGRTWGKRQE